MLMNKLIYVMNFVFLLCYSVVNPEEGGGVQQAPLFQID